MNIESEKTEAPVVGLSPKVAIIDEFLPQALLDAILMHCISSEKSFVPTLLDRSRHVPEFRNSRFCPGGLGELKPAFTDAVRAKLGDLCEAVGIKPFTVAKTEIELVAHGDGGHFQPHIDTYTEENLSLVNSDRLLSAVFYFHRQPKAYTGGELAVFPFGGKEPFELIEPRLNRLVAFPSFAAHEVRHVSCPSGKFANSRFSINCWFRRART